MNSLSSLNNPPDKWQKASFKIERDMKRCAHASVVIDKYLVIIGGWRGGGSQIAANLVVFDMQKETCTQVEISGRNPRYLLEQSACYWKDNQIIVYGGQDSRGTTSEVGIITLSFAESSSLKAEWRTIETGSNILRRLHTAHIYQNQMIVIGGGGERLTEPTAIRILNLDNFTWTEAKIEEKSSEGLLSVSQSILYGKEIYVFGETKDSSCVFLSLNLDTWSWKELPFPGPQDLNLAASQEHQGKIYFVSAAFGEDFFKSFDISKGKWTDLPKPSLKAVSHFSLNVYDNQLFLYGGLNSCLDYTSNELWFFRLGDSVEIQKDSMKEQPKEENIMKKFFTEAPYSDVTFEVDSEQIPAHKWWLCQKSKYFANMFSSGMIEAKSSKIVVTDMTAKTFRAFLEYLYSDDIELDVNMAQDLLTQADKYSVPELKGLCEQFLLSHIEPNNYILLANLSELLEANKLRDAVRDYIAKNIKALKPRKDFEEISIDMLRDVIVKITVR